jgi:orotidine-5'-phosphate decarboxylase
MGFILQHQARPDGSLEIIISTSSTVSETIDAAGVMQAIGAIAKGASVTLVGRELSGADSRLLAWIFAVARECERRGVGL